MTMVKCTSDVIINATDISTIEWDRGHSYTNMVVTMKDGRAIKLRHQPQFLDGTDCYAIEAKLLLATQTHYEVG